MGDEETRSPSRQGDRDPSADVTSPVIPSPAARTPDATVSGIANLEAPERKPAAREAGATGIPDRLGRYTIKRVLGEGGMGTVYLAEQENPRREVALKVIRAGYLAPEMLRRFELESQVLGRLQHPGIAQIYEAGVFASPTRERGDAPPTPFFAMEFIRGVPLTEYADSKRLGTRQRLELIAKVCDAVYHAHQKGVIHRDLKPGNILVTELDSPSGRSTQHAAPSTSAQPKILDFGIARATDSDIQQTTMQTDVGQLIGTVPYMSPEQVGGDPNELDTRSDVYALGVIAYELLAGRLPHDLRRKMIHEAARIIREEEPTRLSSINRTLRGDVETIVAKALEKEKTRRYQSAESLASDIRRYLKDEPIAARPASTWYQAAKFAKRNKGLVTGLSAAFVLLIAGVIGTSIGLSQAVEARDAEAAARKEADTQRDAAVAARTAEERQRKLAEEQRDRAVKAEAETNERAKELKLVSDFQAGMLEQVDPTEAGIRLTRDVNERFAEALKKLHVPEDQQKPRADAFRQEWLRVNATDTALALIDETILKPAVATIDKEFKDQPLVDAQLCQTLADRYTDLGLYDAAFPLQERALATRRRVLGEEHPDALASMNNMGALLKAAGRLTDAEPYYREALEKQRRVLGEDHPDTLASMNNLGLLLGAMGKYAEAERCIRDGLERSRRSLGEDDAQTLSFINGVGFLLRARGKLAEAEPFWSEALEKSRRVLGENHPRTLSSMNNMGVLLNDLGRPAEAEPYYREALERRRRLLGEDHPDTLQSINGMGFLLQSRGRLAEAEPYFREALEKRRRLLGEEHPDTLNSISNMGFMLQAQGRFAEAEPCHREALDKCRRVLGEEHPSTLSCMNNLGFVLYSLGRLAEAESCWRQALETRRRVLGEDHPDTIVSMNNLGALLVAQGKPAEAEVLYREALDASRRVLGEEHPETLMSIGKAGNLLRAMGEFTEAEPYLREALEKRRRLLGENHPDTVTSIGNMGALLNARGEFAEAEPYCREALEKRRRVLGEEHPDTLLSLYNLISLLIKLERFAEAAPMAEECVRGNAHHFGPAHNETRDAITLAVTLYESWDEADPGKGHDAKAAAWKARLDAINTPTPPNSDQATQAAPGGG